MECTGFGSFQNLNIWITKAAGVVIFHSGLTAIWISVKKSTRDVQGIVWRVFNKIVMIVYYLQVNSWLGFALFTRVITVAYGPLGRHVGIGFMQDQKWWPLFEMASMHCHRPIYSRCKMRGSYCNSRSMTSTATRCKSLTEGKRAD